jgi:Spy/CpxP family protein refolding chaperone
MPNRTVWVFAIATACLLGGFSGLRAAEGQDAPPKAGERRPPPGMVLKFILAHAQELGLTDEQKQKFEAIQKEHEGERPPRPGAGEGGGPGEGPFAGVLTPEQREKMRELMKAEVKDRPREAGDRRPPLARIHEFILAHAKDLNLTDEQKQKLDAILKEHQGERPPRPGGENGKGPGGEAGKGPGEGPFAEILTPEQREKLRELLKEEVKNRRPGDEGKAPK